LDMGAIDIQRGRDHGIGPYSDYRVFCGLPRARSFDDLEQWMPTDAVNRIRSVYQNVEDVDLYIGLMSENPVPGGVGGPTLACMIGEQFRRFKFGDRFYHENGGFRHSFTPDQLREIRQFSLATLFCDHSVNIQQMQLEVLRVPSDTNPILSCNDERIRRMDLSPWRESAAA